jgi:tetratricopeptide (TPR) repeat protein
MNAANSLLQDGREALDSGDAHAALRSFERALADNPRFAAAHAGRAEAHILLQDRARALTAWDAALKIEPKNRQWRAERAKLLFHQRAYDRAIEDLNALEELDGSLLGLRGRCHEALGDSSQALADYDAAIALGDQECEAHRGNLKKKLEEDELLLSLLML